MRHFFIQMVFMNNPETFRYDLWFFLSYISVSNPPTLPFKTLPRQSIAVILSTNQK